VKQIPLALAAPAVPTFDAFVVGANAAALQHLSALPCPDADPVYLWGPSGCGKTHLLGALAQAQRCAGRVVCTFDADRPPPWTLDADAVLLTVDACERLDAARQQAAFALFVDAQAEGVPWVAAGRLPPVDLPLRDDLRSRLGWGPVFALQPLAEAETRATLRREASRRGIVLGDEVLDFLLTRVERDLKHLMALLDRLDDFSLAERRTVSVPLVRRMLLEEPTWT
jgi:DnaA family protein